MSVGVFVSEQQYHANEALFSGTAYYNSSTDNDVNDFMSVLICRKLTNEVYRDVLSEIRI